MGTLFTAPGAVDKSTNAHVRAMCVDPREACTILSTEVKEVPRAADVWAASCQETRGKCLCKGAKGEIISPTCAERSTRHPECWEPVGGWRGTRAFYGMEADRFSATHDEEAPKGS